MSSFENYIFDLDGTIIDSSQDVLQTLQLIFEKYGIGYKKDLFKKTIIGPPIHEIIELLIETEYLGKLSTLVEEFRRNYDDLTIYKESFLYPGLDCFLRKISAQGKRLFIATNKPMKPTLRLLDQFRLTKLFEDIYAIDKKGREINMSKAKMIKEIVKNFNLKKDRTMMIGDTLGDIEAAHTSGIQALFVLWGYEKDPDKAISISNFFASDCNQLIY